MSNVTSSIRNLNANVTNPSIGTNGSGIPASSTQVGAEDPSGNLQALLVDNTGKLLVNSGTIFATQDLQVLFNEVSTIAIGVETTIGTYTAPPGKISYLLSILNGGENRAQFNIYNNGVLFDRQYTNVTQLTAPFDYKTGSSSVPGMVIAVGNVVTVTVVNSGTSTANYNSRFMVLEVT